VVALGHSNLVVSYLSVMLVE